MEATGDPTEHRTLRSRIRSRIRTDVEWIFAKRAIRFPILVLLGAAATFVASRYIQANYVELCERFEYFPARCEPVALRPAFSVGLAIAGLAMLVFGPIVNSLYHLMRYGQAGESSRVETAISNYPLLAGVIYLAGAAVLVFA